MYENIYVQLYVFLYTLYGGIIIGILYDLVDIIINGSIIKRRSISDLIFWAMAFTIIVGLLFYVNNVTFRFYVIIGFALGWFLYFLTLSKIIRKICTCIKNVIGIIGKRVIAVFKVVFYPIRIILAKKDKAVKFCKKVYIKLIKDFKKYKTYLFKS